MADIIFPKNTEIWISPQTDTAPDLVGALGANWRNVGCVETFSMAGTKQTKKVYCHGKVDPIATFLQSIERTLSVTVKDLSPENWALTFGGAEFLQSVADTDSALMAIDATTNEQLSALVRFNGSRKEDLPANPGQFIDPVVYGFWLPNLEVSSAAEFDAGAAEGGDELNIAITFDLLQASVDAAENPYGSPIVPRSNDPEWAALAAAAGGVVV